MTDFNIPPAAMVADTCKEALLADMEYLDGMELWDRCEPWTECATLAVMKDRQMIADELERAVAWNRWCVAETGVPHSVDLGVMRKFIAALRAAAVDPLVGA